MLQILSIVLAFIVAACVCCRRAGGLLQVTEQCWRMPEAVSGLFCLSVLHDANEV